MEFKKIGILGGMGPEATADFYMKIINIFQNKFGAKYDSDFPQIIINSIPLPDIVETETNEKEIEKMLIEGAILLERAGADFITIPCNSVSKFIPSMRTLLKIPILSIIEETIRKIKGNKIGVLGTNYTLDNKIYENPLKIIKKDVILPNEVDRRELTSIIINILSNKDKKILGEEISKIISKLRERGCEEIILGCTELPLITDKSDYLINSLQVLAEETIKYCINNIQTRIEKYDNRG